MRKIILFFAVIGIIAAIIIRIYIFSFSSNSWLCFDKDCFKIEIADNDAERQAGLGNRSSIDSDRGMLFVFDKEEIYTFWMKDMNFPLDIIWMNKEGKVVFIVNDAQPCNETCIYLTPDKKAISVLEVSANSTNKYNISVGDMAVFYP